MRILFSYLKKVMVVIMLMRQNMLKKTFIAGSNTAF